ncbi:MAG: arginyltransferase [Armatimonadota bacterium]
MLVLQQFKTGPEPCAYLPEQSATLEYSYTPILTPQEYEDAMNRGCRKFGPLLFRPVCAACTACRPIRIPVAAFSPDRSQRRAWKANADLTVRLGRPVVDDARLELFNRYHEARAETHGWRPHDRDAEEYAFSFVENPLPAVEISLWEEDRLRAIVITELTPNVVSGVYHYHDPDLARRSLGTFCMLQTLELARRLEKPWAYFGFYVEGCGSLAYKARFRPCEVMGVDGVWRPFVEP